MSHAVITASGKLYRNVRELVFGDKATVRENRDQHSYNGRPYWEYIEALERAGDRLAHEHAYRDSPAAHQAWWDARGKHCTVCEYQP